MAKPPFAVGDIVVSQLTQIDLKAEGVECRLSESDGPICRTISMHGDTLAHDSRTLIAYTRKCQAIEELH